MTKLESFRYGLFLPFKSAKLILSDVKLLLLSLIPITLTLLLYFYILGESQTWIESQTLNLFSKYQLDTTALWAKIILWILKVLVFIFAALLFSTTSTLVASPFNDFLAESAERYADPPFLPAPQTSLKGKFRLLRIDFLKALASAGAGLVALFFAWVPVLNICAFLFALFLLTFQYTSYPQTRRFVGLKEGLLFLAKNSWSVAGFGLTLSFMFSIPILASFALPLAVVGGTLLVAKSQPNY